MGDVIYLADVLARRQYDYWCGKHQDWYIKQHQDDESDLGAYIRTCQAAARILVQAISNRRIP